MSFANHQSVLGVGGKTCCSIVLITWRCLLLGTWGLGYSESIYSFGCTCSKRLIHDWFLWLCLNQLKLWSDHVRQRLGMITGSADGIAVRTKGKVVRYAWRLLTLSSCSARHSTSGIWDLQISATPMSNGRPLRCGCGWKAHDLAIKDAPFPIGSLYPTI